MRDSKPRIDQPATVQIPINKDDHATLVPNLPQGRKSFMGVLEAAQEDRLLRPLLSLNSFTYKSMGVFMYYIFSLSSILGYINYLAKYLNPLSVVSGCHSSLWSKAKLRLCDM